MRSTLANKKNLNLALDPLFTKTYTCARIVRKRKFQPTLMLDIQSVTTDCQWISALMNEKIYEY